MKIYSKLDNRPVYTAGVAASILNLNQKTIINYERSNLIKISRTEKGRRLYSQRDLLNVHIIRYLMKVKGMTQKGIEIVLPLLEKAKDNGVDLYEEILPDEVLEEFFRLIS